MLKFSSSPAVRIFWDAISWWMNCCRIEIDRISFNARWSTIWSVITWIKKLYFGCEILESSTCMTWIPLYETKKTKKKNRFQCLFFLELLNGGRSVHTHTQTIIHPPICIMFTEIFSFCLFLPKNIFLQIENSSVRMNENCLIRDGKLILRRNL